MNAVQLQRIDENLQRLRLFKYRERLEALLQQATAEELSYAEFLDTVLGEVREHFLRPVMYLATVDPLNAHWSPYLVYDGQQRLATVSLILKAPRPADEGKRGPGRLRACPDQERLSPRCTPQGGPAIPAAAQPPGMRSPLQRGNQLEGESAALPGRHITHRRKRLLITLKKTDTVELADCSPGVCISLKNP